MIHLCVTCMGDLENIPELENQAVDLERLRSCRFEPVTPPPFFGSLSVELDSDEYNAEESGVDENETTVNWEAKTCWNNYHACHFGGDIPFPCAGGVFDAEQLTRQPIVLVDHQPDLDNDNIDTLSIRQLAFDECYILGHDTIGKHTFRFAPLKKNGEPKNTFELHWTGKVALTYTGERSFNHDFRVQAIVTIEEDL